jgi:hypothetical protein
MTMTDDDLETYLDIYVSRLNPQGRKELGDYLAPRIAAAVGIDPETAETRFTHGWSNREYRHADWYPARYGDSWYLDPIDDPPIWLKAYLWCPGWFARAPGAELWVRFDLLPDAVRERLEPRRAPRPEWETPDENGWLARRADHIRAVEADPKRKQAIEEYLADVKAEAQKIDTENAEFLRDHVPGGDPYDLYVLPLELIDVDKAIFVRRLPDGFWVLLEDLPLDMQLKLENRPKPSFSISSEGEPPWLDERDNDKG